MNCKRHSMNVFFVNARAQVHDFKYVDHAVQARDRKVMILGQDQVHAFWRVLGEMY